MRSALLVLILATALRTAAETDWSAEAASLAQRAKWAAAAAAQARAVEGLAARESAQARRELALAHLLLARYRINANELGAAESGLETAPIAARNSVSAAALRIETALDREELETAAQLVDELKPRGLEPLDELALPQLYCTALTVESLHAFLAGRLATARRDHERAVPLLEQVSRASPQLADATLLLANALHETRRGSAALERLEALAADAPVAGVTCPGVLVESVLFNGGNIAWDYGETDRARTLYERAIAAAEEREESFAAWVRSRRDGVPVELRSILLSAQRDPSQAAPAARNNLGQLLLELAGEEDPDPAVLIEATRQFRAAAANPDYSTPQYAHLGHAHAELRGGQLSEAVRILAKALWADPAYRNALDMAASIARQERTPDTASDAAAVLLVAARTAVPQAWLDARYGPTLDELAERVAQSSSEPAQRFLAYLDLQRGELGAAAERLERARTAFADSVWPFALSGEVALLNGNDGAALESFRRMSVALAKPAGLHPLDAFALREVAAPYAATAAELKEPAAVRDAETLLASVFGAAAGEVAHVIPWDGLARLEGTLSDEAGAALPGVTVTLVSPFGLSFETVTNAEGEYVALAPPGTYTLTAHLTGFQANSRTVTVAHGTSAAALSMTLRTGVSESIEVTAEPPIVVTTAGEPLGIDPDFLEELPRRLADYAVLDPGESGVHAEYGVANRHNNLYVDGVNVGAPFVTTWTQPVERWLAFAESIQLTTSARSVSAPDARAQLFTRSGTNEVSGTAEVMAQPEGLRGDPAPVVVPRERQDRQHSWRAGATLGGPLERDRLWLYGLVARQEERGSTFSRLESLPSTRERTEALAKLTASLAGNISSTASLHYVGDRRDGALEDAAGALLGIGSANDRVATRETWNGIVSATRAISSSTAAEARLSTLRDESTLRPGSAAAEKRQLRTPEEGFVALGGVGFINDGRRFGRDGAAAHVDLWRGYRSEHHIRVGAEYSRERDRVNDRLSGGSLLESEDFRFWRHTDGVPAAAIRETFRSTPLSVYMNDRMTVHHFIIQAGLRWLREAVDFPGGHGLTTDVLQPRLNVTYGPGATWNVFAALGRYAEPLTPDERVAFGSGRRYALGEEAYGGIAAIDRSLGGRHEDELTAGGTLITGRTTVRLTGVRRRLRNEIQDSFCTADLRRCIGNPGRGLLSTLRTLEGEEVDAPRARRELDAVDLALTGRAFGGDWGVGYLWARRRGNVDAPDVASTRVNGIDPYARPEFDFAETTPPFGPLAHERRHTLRAYATARKGRFLFSTIAWWQSGEPRGAFGYSALHGRYAFFEAARGERGRSASAYDLDARIAYEWRLSDRASLRLATEIENALDRQNSLIDDQRADLATAFEPLERSRPRTMRFVAKVEF